MPTATLVQIAQAITAELSLLEFDSLRLTPKRSYADWDEKLDETCVHDQLHIDVVPVGHPASELESRGGLTYRCDVDVGVRYKLEPHLRDGAGQLDIGKVDSLVLLVESIHEYFIDDGNGRRLLSFPEAAWVETKIRQTYNREHLRQLGQFTAIIRLTYEVTK